MALLAEFGFNEGAGLVAADSSGNGLTLAATNTSTSWDAAGHYGSGARIQHAGSMGPNSALSTFTFMFWAKRTGTWSAFASPFGVAAGAGSWYVEADASATYQIDFFGNTNTNSTSGAANQFTLDTWRHIAVTRDGTNTRLYVDGVLQGSAVANATHNFNPSHVVSGMSGDESSSFVGVVDDLRIFDTQLTQAEIQTWMAINVGQPVAVVPPPPEPTFAIGDELLLEGGITGGSYINHATVAAPRNGTTGHTVHPDGTGGTVVDGAAFTPAAGSLLVCLVEGAVTSTTPTGWSLPSNGSAINNTGLYVFTRSSASGTSADQIATTHNGSDYPAVFDFYEFPAGSTFTGANSAINVAEAAGAGPSLSVSGTNWTAGVFGQGWSASATYDGVTTWDHGTREVDTGVNRGGAGSTDGYQYSLAYTAGDTSTSVAYAATSSGLASATCERLVIAVSVASVSYSGNYLQEDSSGAFQLERLIVFDVGDDLLQEDGFSLLQEDGSTLVALESTVGYTGGDTIWLQDWTGQLLLEDSSGGFQLEPAAVTGSVTATVGFASTSALTVTGSQTISPAVGFASSSALAVTPLVTHFATIALVSSSALTVTPAVTELATIALVSSSALTVTGAETISATIPLVSSSVLAVTPLVTELATIALVQSSALAITATVTGGQAASVAFVQSSTLAITPLVTHPYAVPFVSTSALTVTGSQTIPATIGLVSTSALTITALVTHPYAVGFVSTSTLAVSPALTGFAAVGFVSTSALAVAGFQAIPATVGFVSSSALSVAATVTGSFTIPLVQSSALTVTPLVTHLPTVALASSSTLTVAGLQTIFATIALVQTSTLAITATVTGNLSIPFVQSSTLAVAGTKTITGGAVALVQTSTLAITATPIHLGTVALVQTSTLTVTVTVGRLATITLVSSSVLAVTGRQTWFAAIPFTSSSSLTVTALLAHLAAIALVQTSTLAVVADVAPPIIGADIDFTVTTVQGDRYHVSTGPSHTQAGTGPSRYGADTGPDHSFTVTTGPDRYGGG